MLVSVVIPTLNEAANILECVAAAWNGYGSDDVEIVVVDGGSSDATAALVPADVRLLHSERGRGLQMNVGASTSRGDLLVFCHADSRLPAGWREAVVETLAHPGVIAGAFQPLILPEWGLLRLVNRLRLPAHSMLFFGDQAMFMSREAFERVGGFPPIPLIEDVRMARALDPLGRLVRVPLRVITSSRRFRERGFVRQTLHNIWMTIGHVYLGASPEKMARWYSSSRNQRLR